LIKKFLEIRRSEEENKRVSVTPTLFLITGLLKLYSVSILLTTWSLRNLISLLFLNHRVTLYWIVPHSSVLPTHIFTSCCLIYVRTSDPLKDIQPEDGNYSVC
jgi:hypothetical protein